MRRISIKIRLASILAVLMLVAGCTNPGAVPPDTAGIPEEPVALTEFTFSERGSSIDSIYSYTAERTETGAFLHIELNCGRDIIEVEAEEDVLGELGAIASEYRLDMWDGFDKNKKRVSDGRGFTLSMTTADGREISARGSNSFPDNYSDARRAINELFQKYI